jgi:cytochrome c oxidase subunit 4
MHDAMMDPAAAPEALTAERPAPRYMMVFLALAILTAIELGVAFVGLSRRLTILVLIALALWKALLVALYYMHLRYEPRRLHILLLAVVPLPFILVLAVLTEF